MKIQLSHKSQSQVSTSALRKTAAAGEEAKMTPFGPLPDAKKLPLYSVLAGRLDLVKFKAKGQASKFKNLDVFDWFNLDGEPVFIVGKYLYLNGKNPQFAQMSLKTELATINANISKHSVKGTTVEIIVGKNHLLVMSYAYGEPS